MNDDRLEQRARRLGESAAERLDVAATARKVVERLRERPVRRITWIHRSWVRIAAAVVILVGGAGLVRRIRTADRSSRHAAHLVSDDLNDLSTAELRDVLSSFDEIVTSDTVAVPESTNDLRELDAPQLRAVLRDLEG
jgi:hypothetical protein